MADLLSISSTLAPERQAVLTNCKGVLFLATPNQGSPLATLASKPGLSIGGLADIAVSKQPTVTRLLDRMEARALVQRYPHDSDRRITMVRITPKGRTIVAHLMDQAKEHEHRVLQPFGLKRAESLKVTLRRIIELHRGPA